MSFYFQRSPSENTTFQRIMSLNWNESCNAKYVCRMRDANKIWCETTVSTFHPPFKHLQRILPLQPLKIQVAKSHRSKLFTRREMVFFPYRISFLFSFCFILILFLFLFTNQAHIGYSHSHSCLAASTESCESALYAWTCRLLLYVMFDPNYMIRISNGWHCAPYRRR